MSKKIFSAKTLPATALLTTVLPTRLLLTTVLLMTSMAVVILTGCRSEEGSSVGTQASVPSVPVVEKSIVEKSIAVKKAATTATFSEFLEKAYREVLIRSPLTMEARGDYSQNDQWDNFSAAFADESLQIHQRYQTALGHYSRDILDTRQQLSYDLFAYETNMAIETDQFRYHSYPINQMFGLQSSLMTHLINNHKVDSLDDAKAYLQRLEKLPEVFSQIETHLAISQQKGITAPTFALELAINQMRMVLAGKPFQPTSEKDTVILADFNKKVAGLSLPSEDYDALLARVENALLTAVKPAYEQLIKTTSALAAKTAVNGVWALPDGEAYYRHLLKRYTTMDMTADEIHQLGWHEIRRIHGEIGVIMKQLNFEGDLPAFYRYTQEDPRFFYTKDEKGREQAVADAKRVIGQFKQQLDQWFITRPKADIDVKPVEAFREASSPVAFYYPGTPDGSRNGIYYINTYDPKEMPIWQMAAIAYHEAIPGHHMQISIAQEKSGLPSFRKFLYYSAFGEGWGMYSEYLPKEAGFYQNPYDDYGRLVMELLRACRLVADTGIHHKRWTREQAIQFLQENMPITKERAARSVQRYFVLPGQATSYKIGQLKILALRENAKKQLGSTFDIREFHDVVLSNGALSLSILQQVVQTWVESKAAEKG
jgi:uncharacterized protein (DUF885 family)